MKDSFSFELNERLKSGPLAPANQLLNYRPEAGLTFLRIVYISQTRRMTGTS